MIGYALYLNLYKVGLHWGTPFKLHFSIKMPKLLENKWKQMCHKTLSILVKEVCGNCIVNVCLGVFFYVFTSEASSSLAGNLHSTHSINISGASSVLFSSVLVLAGPSSGNWYWWSTAVTSYLFCVACEANEGFYSFKWFLKVHNNNNKR